MPDLSSLWRQDGAIVVRPRPLCNSTPLRRPDPFASIHSSTPVAPRVAPTACGS